MKTYKVQFTSNGYNGMNLVKAGSVSEVKDLMEIEVRNHGALPITSIEIELYETLKEKNEREN